MNKSRTLFLRHELRWRRNRIEIKKGDTDYKNLAKSIPIQSDMNPGTGYSQLKIRPYTSLGGMVENQIDQEN